MAATRAVNKQPKRFSARLAIILLAASAAVLIPVLPIKLGAPGGETVFGVTSMLDKSKKWLTEVVSEISSSQSSPAPTNQSPGQLNLLARASQRIEAEIKVKPGEPSLHNQLGLLYLNAGEMDRAQECFERAVNLSNAQLQALERKVSADQQTGRSGDASQALVEASRLSIELSGARTNLARVYDRRGEHDKVIAQLDSLSRQSPLLAASPAAGRKQAPSTDPNVVQLMREAQISAQARQLDRAEAAYRGAIAINPELAPPHHGLGTVLAMKDNLPQAIEELERAAKLDPNSDRIQNDLGRAYQMSDKVLPSISAYEKALTLSPQSCDPAINLSNIYASQGRLDDAARVLTLSLQSAPNNARAHNNLGTVLAMQGIYPQALYEFEKTIALDPSMASAHYGMGTVLMQTHSYFAAAKAFRDALALDPHHASARVRMEEAYRKAGSSAGVAEALN